MALFTSHPVADADYLLRRAEAEAQLAESAGSRTAAAAHERLASNYLGRLFDDAAAVPKPIGRRSGREALLRQLAERLTRRPPPSDDSFNGLLRELD